MSVSDPVADFLTCVRNAIRAKHRKGDCPASKPQTRKVLTSCSKKVTRSKPTSWRAWRALMTLTRRRFTRTRCRRMMYPKNIWIRSNGRFMRVGAD